MRFLKNSDISDLKEVTSLALVAPKTGTFDKDGIFSPRIFGSDEYSCECGALKAAWHMGEICDKCGTPISKPSDNIYKNGRFIIPNGYKVFNPTIYTIIKKHIKNFENMINPDLKHGDKDGHIIYEDEKTNLKLLNFMDFSLNYRETIEKIFQDTEIEASIEVDDEFDKHKPLNLKDFLLENEDSVMLSSIPLLPIHLRPTQKDGTQMQIEPLNKSFIEINTHINSIRHNVDDDNLTAIDKELFKIQQEYMELYDSILELISKKEGIARNQILSNKINLSGRAVITVNHDNDPNSVTVPKIMFTEIYMPKIITKLSHYLNLNYVDSTEYYYLNRFDLDNKYIDMCINDLLLEKPMVLINRNPSLHLLSIQAFYISGVTKDHTIKLPKTCLQSLNADFDGDTVAIFTLDTEEAKAEAKRLLTLNNLLSNKAFDINKNILPYQDDALGLYLMDFKNK